MTPEQIRALADELDEEAQEWDGESVVGPKFTNGAAALRAAADQIEAVQEWADHADPVYADLTALYAILTATPAPQEWSVVLVKRGGHFRYVKVIGGDWDGAIGAAENANDGWEGLQAGPLVKGNGIAYHSTVTAPQEEPRD